jgi:dinuclear metal center YbgI/SA1388 family protein
MTESQGPVGQAGSKRGTSAAAAVGRDALVGHLDHWLQAAQFKDYGPNGLQVQGREQVRRLVTGVTASRALIEAAIEAQADAVLVHHGLFWRGQDGRLTGWLGERVRLLMRHDINLLAYHLPLDAHASHGNNAQLGLRLGMQADARFGEQQLGFIGPAVHVGLEALTQAVHHSLQRTPLVVPGDGRALQRVAWCTGGAQGYFEAAIAAGADAFITGEISEPQAHLARETGVAFLACGHHATERFGAPAVGQAVAEHFGLEHVFIEVDNPA